MGEVSEMFDVKPSLLRHWESKFDILRPHKNKKGNRMFTPEDVENLKLIYHLVKERGMTLNGAAQYLRNGVTDTMRRDMMLLDRLQYIRSELDAVRQLLRDGSDDSLSDEDDAAASDEEYGPDDQTVDSTLAEPDHEEADTTAAAAESTYDDDTDEALMSGNEASDSAQEQSSTVEAIEITAAETDVTAEMDEAAAEDGFAADTGAETEWFDEPEIFPEMRDIAETTTVPVADAGNPEDDMEDPEEEPETDTETGSEETMIPPAFPRGSRGAKRSKRQDTKLFEVAPEPQKPIAPYFDQTLF